MEFTLLSELQRHDIHAVIRVSVIRKWDFRGISDIGPVQHVDMVLADEQGNAIYAEIPSSLVADKSPRIEVNKIYDIRRFKILPARSLYKPVNANLMIQFTVFTETQVAADPPDTFPSLIYILTDFSEINDLAGQTENFIDVLGVVTDVQPLRQASERNTTVIRDIIIKNINNCSLQLTLWGQRAKDLSIHGVYSEKPAKPIVVLFVGCLAKHFKACTTRRSSTNRGTCTASTTISQGSTDA